MKNIFANAVFAVLTVVLSFSSSSNANIDFKNHDISCAQAKENSDLVLSLIQAKDIARLTELAQGNPFELDQEYISHATQVAGIDYCGGAIWCIFIPSRIECNYKAEDGCHWVR